MTDVITLSERAWAFVLRPGMGEGRALVVRRKPTGCAGWSYALTRERFPPRGCVVAEVMLPDGPAWVAVPQADAPHLEGTHADVVRQGLGWALTWTNPQEVGRCGCGISVQTATAVG